jgi:hypothetical protein
MVETIETQAAGTNEKCGSTAGKTCPKYVHGPRFRFHENIGGGDRVFGDVQSLGNVVAIAGGQKSEGNVTAKGALHEMMERAIAAERDDASVSCGCSLSRALTQVVRAIGTDKIRGDAMVLEEVGDKRLGAKRAAAARYGVHNYQNVRLHRHEGFDRRSTLGVLGGESARANVPKTA